MKIQRAGPKARALIAQYEGDKLKAYPDPATGGEPFTIGKGFTMPGKIKPGDTIPQWASDALFDYALLIREITLNELLNGADTDAGQFGAMLSLMYNIGDGNFASSTLLKKHKAGDFRAAGAEFLKWDKAAGKVMTGLTRRRQAENALYRIFR